MPRVVNPKSAVNWLFFLDGASHHDQPQRLRSIARYCSWSWHKVEGGKYNVYGYVQFRTQKKKYTLEGKWDHPTYWSPTTIFHQYLYTLPVFDDKCSFGVQNKVLPGGPGQTDAYKFHKQLKYYGITLEPDDSIYNYVKFDTYTADSSE